MAEKAVTANRNLKRRVRTRAAKTGESYTAALRHFRPTPRGDEKIMTETMETAAKRVRLAVAQNVLGEDPGDAAAVRASGVEVRRLMREAAAAGARVVHFAEGATCAPNKYVMSAEGPERVGAAQWERAAWDVLRAEVAETARYAGELGIWTVLGSVHQLTAPHRPHNSLYVIDNRGSVVTRYDERMLSNTKISHMYAPGTGPRTFEVDGVRFGCLLGMEVHFPELFAEYERLDVDCVLFSSTGGPTAKEGVVFATEARGHAAVNSFWVSFAMGGQYADTAPSGVIAPTGEWLERCPASQGSAIAVAGIDDGAANVAVAVGHARPWRRTARSGLYEQHHVLGDERSADLTLI